MKSKLLPLLILALLFSGSAAAHEYWFEPQTFFPAPNERTPVHLYVGDGLTKDREERVFQPAKTDLFQLFSATDALNLKPLIKEEAVPVYVFSADVAGNYLLAMERNWSYIKIEPQKFEDYLREDGIDFIIAERDKLGERKKEGRERYSRFIKTLLQVGDRRDDVYKKVLGLKLEITPLENPYAKKIGGELKFQVTFDGKPLVNRVVFADNRLNKESQRMTTDQKGQVSVKLNQSGLWLVRLVNMRRCAGDCGEADWESFWGAFSFGVK